MSDLRILVVGLGSIGRRHIYNLKEIEPGTQIIVWRREHNSSDLGDAASLVDQVVTSLSEAVSLAPDAALVTNPASRHMETSLGLAEQGIHLFIEKPLSNTLEGVDTLLSLCREPGLVLMVGYNFRFYRPLQVMQKALQEGCIGRTVSLRAEVGQFLPEWRPGSDYRKSVSARQELGGGAVLELSHELDYARWLVGEVAAVSAQVGHLSDLEIDVEDTAEIILRFCNGSIGSIHLDMVQQPATRTCCIVGTEGMLTWDGNSHQVRLFSNRLGVWSDLHPAKAVDRNEMYVAEMGHFLQCVRGYASPLVSGEDGRRVLEIALAAKLSSAKGRMLAL